MKDQTLEDSIDEITRKLYMSGRQEEWAGLPSASNTVAGDAKQALLALVKTEVELAEKELLRTIYTVNAFQESTHTTINDNVVREMKKRGMWQTTAEYEAEKQRLTKDSNPFPTAADFPKPKLADGTEVTPRAISRFKKSDSLGYKPKRRDR